MAAEKADVLTSGAIAKELGVSPASVSKVIKQLNIQPELKKAGCNYFSKSVVDIVKSELDKK